MQHQRRQKVHRQRHQGERRQGAALGGQGLVDVAGFQRQHAQHLLDVAHRQGDGDDALALLVPAQGRLGHALQGALDLGRQLGVGARQPRLFARRRLGRGQGGSRRMGRGQGSARNGVADPIGVRHLDAVDVEQAGALARRNEVVAQPQGGRAVVQHGIGVALGDAQFAQDVGQQFGLDAQRFLARLDQAALPFVQQQGAAEQDQQAEKIEGQDEAAQARAAEAESSPRRGVLGFSSRGSGIRRHTGSR
ncbi:hypothetical protein D3C73_1007950 [compost metagenome]